MAAQKAQGSRVEDKTRVRVTQPAGRRVRRALLPSSWRLQVRATGSSGSPGSASSTPVASTSASPAPATILPPVAAPTKPPPPQHPPNPTPVVPKRPVEPASAAPSPVPLKKKALAVAAPIQLDLPRWEDATISNVFGITLKKEVAEKSSYEIVWLKGLAEELQGEGVPLQLNAGVADRTLIARLELDPHSMSDDLEFLPQTVLEYLIGCWKRLNASRAVILRKTLVPLHQQHALDTLDKVRDLIISYTGLTLQEPEMFPQPNIPGKELGAAELTFLHDIVRRFEPDNELDTVLGPVVVRLCSHESLQAGFASGDGWRGVVSGLEALISVKAIAAMITRLPEWNPDVPVPEFELKSVMGQLLRLGYSLVNGIVLTFFVHQPSISGTYFTNHETRPQGEITSAMASLRGTLKTLQASLFQIFNTLVRASPDAREAVLQYFSRAVNINRKRAGMQVDPLTVSTDCFVMNLQIILLQFCEPFMDSQYSKMDKIDPAYYAHSSRIDLSEETRINATNEEAEEWRTQNETISAPPNFISDIFYLTLAVNHIGQQKLTNNVEELMKQYDDIRRNLEILQEDQSWMGTAYQARTEAVINAGKAEKDKVYAAQLAYETQLSEPELVFRSISFANLVSTWLVRHVDPLKRHPNPAIVLPLPKDVPISFRVLPEYLVEDVIEYHLYVIRQSPKSLELSGRNEMIVWCLTWLTSTWFIKNPFLKAKIVEVLFLGTWSWGEHRSVLTTLLNTHPMALKHLMPCLMNFYVEVEQTGASSQFYDKFNSRRNIAYIFKVIWNNSPHRDALKDQAAHHSDRFVRFVNLMINDVTYLLDESLTQLSKINQIQTEMKDRTSYEAQPQQYRREREGELRTLERQASSYVQLGNSTVGLLKLFTSEVKSPFMVPEIVDRLAAMLDYNLDVLIGRSQQLKVKNPEKYKFNPRQLLGDLIDIFLNLSDQGDFARAVAGDGRSYRKELFESAAKTLRKNNLKSPDEIEKLRLFTLKVEEMKATLEAEDDLGEIPDEFLDPLMYTIMRDPVTLPTSKAVVDRATIKSHLLSDSKDPFNRTPLSLDQVEPNVELKQRIDAFLAERRNKNTALDKPAEEVVHMDVSPE
ncbi:ubiquitin elongating factor core-domain-containing protein [Epithele typhae]|uniref:ubiquitin elongating factor core-domain-containing protein n=1 Tax=Epithele typhae TaxID=378194 RepID=UPI0020076995|nr:ubiquitin elongating factor core-domain-containing protein [Epithele typhae]KAH9922853.1 ubiquitin elongating factor core-domain-containing protein [Epithele typhae]